MKPIGTFTTATPRAMSKGDAPEFDLILETDGSTKKTNPGPSAWGFVALGPFSNVIYEDCGVIPKHCTSNEAEYWALIHALRFAKDLGYVKRIEIRADSLTMIRQLEGKYGFRSEGLNHLATLVGDVLDTFDVVSLLWVPRKWNGHADALASAAFEHNKNAAVRRIKRDDFERMPEDHRLWEKEMNLDG